MELSSLISVSEWHRCGIGCRRDCEDSVDALLGDSNRTGQGLRMLCHPVCQCRAILSASCESCPFQPTSSGLWIYAATECACHEADSSWPYKDRGYSIMRWLSWSLPCGRRAMVQGRLGSALFVCVVTLAIVVIGFIHLSRSIWRLQEQRTKLGESSFMVSVEILGCSL